MSADCKPTRKKITVITATFNLVKGKRKDVFIKMFKSVHQQTYPNIEHLIMDGGSKDGTLDFIQKINSRYGRKELRIISEPDKGITDATIKGYHQARGEYIILMCSDDYYLRNDALELLANALEEQQADFACADGWWMFSHTWIADLDSFVYRHPFMISTLLAKKELFDKYGYFDPSYEVVADYELMFRLLSNPDIKGAVVPKTVTVLRPGGFSQIKLDLFQKETIRVYRTYFSKKCRLTEKEIRLLHWLKLTSQKSIRKISANETNPKILKSFKKGLTYQRPFLRISKKDARLGRCWNAIYRFIFKKDYFTRDHKFVANPFVHKLPKWLCDLCCRFIFKEHNRQHFRERYCRW